MSYNAISTPMRILHVAEAFGGGLFEICRLQAEGQAAHGHTVAIAFGRRPETPTDVRGSVDPSVELFELPWGRRSVIEQFEAARALRALARSWRPDVVHLQSTIAGAVGAMVLSTKYPTIYSPQGYSFSMASVPPVARNGLRLVERLVARRVAVVGASSFTEGEQARSIGARRVVSVENGVPELDQPEFRDESGAVHRRVVALGRIAPQRQPEACARMLAAVSDLADVEWIGGGQTASSGYQALSDNGVPISGWRTRDEVFESLRTADIYLHWTGWDGLPLSVLEALARDAVVVASDIGPNREVLGPRSVCRSENEAITLIRSLLIDEKTYGELNREQRARRQYYSAQRMVDGWVQLYADTLRVWSRQVDTRSGPANDVQNGSGAGEYSSTC